MNQMYATILPCLQQRACLILELLERLPAHDILAEYESAFLERPQQTFMLLENDPQFQQYAGRLAQRMEAMIRQLQAWPRDQV
jgi:hypothetical protein